MEGQWKPGALCRFAFSPQCTVPPPPLFPSSSSFRPHTLAHSHLLVGWPVLIAPPGRGVAHQPGPPLSLWSMQQARRSSPLRPRGRTRGPCHQRSAVHFAHILFPWWRLARTLPGRTPFQKTPHGSTFTAFRQQEQQQQHRWRRGRACGVAVVAPCMAAASATTAAGPGAPMGARSSGGGVSRDIHFPRGAPGREGERGRGREGEGGRDRGRQGSGTSASSQGKRARRPAALTWQEQAACEAAETQRPYKMGRHGRLSCDEPPPSTHFQPRANLSHNGNEIFTMACTCNTAVAGQCACMKVSDTRGSGRRRWRRGGTKLTVRKPIPPPPFRRPSDGRLPVRLVPVLRLPAHGEGVGRCCAVLRCRTRPRLRCWCLSDSNYLFLLQQTHSTQCECKGASKGCSCEGKACNC